jgi:hypothetical protein
MHQNAQPTRKHQSLEVNTLPCWHAHIGNTHLGRNILVQADDLFADNLHRCSMTWL